MCGHLTGMDLIRIYYIGVYLTSVHYISMHIIGVYLTCVHLMGVCSQACIPCGCVS